MLQSKDKDNPSLGAVKVQMPLKCAVSSQDARLRVRQVEPYGNADSARIQQGDIVRAVSLPAIEGSQTSPSEAPWWARIGRAPVPPAEEGMVILDGRGVADFEAALRENARVDGQQAEVTLILERPVNFNSGKDDDFWGGMPAKVTPEFAPGLVPIPIPVDDGKNPPGVPGPLPPQGQPRRSSNIRMELPLQTQVDSRGDSVELSSNSHSQGAGQQLEQEPFRKAYESLKKDIDNILRAEPHWDAFSEDLQVTDPTGSTLNLASIKKLLALVRKFRRKFSSQDAVNIDTQLSSSAEPVMTAQGSILLGGLRIPLTIFRLGPLLRLKIQGSARIYFNAEGKIKQVMIDKWLFNGKTIPGLPKLPNHDVDSLTNAEVAALMKWTTRIILR
jgi:hypothetical protein